MDGQFLIRQIYDDEITYNLITAAVEILSELNCVYNFSAVCHIRRKCHIVIGPYVWQHKHTYSLYVCVIRHSAHLFIRDDLISLKLYTEIPADDILELFGKTFFDFCQDSGYDKILQVLGATPRDFLQVCVCVRWNFVCSPFRMHVTRNEFLKINMRERIPLFPLYNLRMYSTLFRFLFHFRYLRAWTLAYVEINDYDCDGDDDDDGNDTYTMECGQNLDALHDHLGTLYPGMRAPSFRCSEETDGSLILHYYSDRPGLEHIVIGIVKVSKHHHAAVVNIFLLHRFKSATKVNERHFARQTIHLTFSFPFHFSFHARALAFIRGLCVIVTVCNQAVASKLHGVEVEISVVKRKGEQLYADNDSANKSDDTDLSMAAAAAAPSHTSANVAGRKTIHNILHHSNSYAKCTSRTNEKLIHPSNSLESDGNDNCNTVIAATAPRATTAPMMAKRKKEVELSDHIQFLITEKTPHRTCSADDVVVREPLDEGDVVTDGTYFQREAAQTKMKKEEEEVKSKERKK